MTTPVGSSVPTTDTWPASVGFVHVKVVTDVRPEFAANPAAFGSGQGQEISSALLDCFLPARKSERDKALSAELRRNGITLPDDELLNLKPESMKLKAGGIAKGNAAREAGLRTEEVNRILREEPPRRTVTGSFRVH